MYVLQLGALYVLGATATASASTPVSVMSTTTSSAAPADPTICGDIINDANNGK